VGVGLTLRVDDMRSRFAGDQRSRGSVPGLVGHHDAGVERSLGDEREVERCGPDHADTFDARYEFGGEREPGLVMRGSLVADGVVAKGHDRFGEAVSVADVDRLAVKERPLVFDGVIRTAKQRGMGDGDDGGAAVHQGQRYRAQG